MTTEQSQIIRFLGAVHPYSSVPPEALDAIAPKIGAATYSKGDTVYTRGEQLPGIYLIYDGTVEVTDAYGNLVSHLAAGNSFGERGLMLDGTAATNAVCSDEAVLILIPADVFADLRRDYPAVTKFFARSSARPQTQAKDLTSLPVSELMTPAPERCIGTDTAQHAAQTMRDKRISALCVMDGDALTGILTVKDISTKLVADGLPADTAISALMTSDPLTLPTSAIGSDVLHMMVEKRISHVPVMEAGRLAGIVTQTDLTRFQALSSAELISGIARADTAEDMATATAQIPDLLVQLVASGRRHDIVTRLITDIADTVTRRLCALAEAQLGPAPVPYLWLACGSQGRQEQTGVSDQDNCLILDDAATEDDLAYFAKFARIVCDGLNTCGYVYCPGDMMAVNPQWCQPIRVWERYFTGWIDKPDPEAQMLASVMFDLRPISGEVSLFEGLQERTLAAAAKNSIFVRHMVSNSLSHSTPLGLLRGIATIRSGEHKNSIDMKHNGVVPIVDMGRVYALRGELAVANTRARIETAQAAGQISATGGADLLDAYDLIAELRLENQSRQIKAGDAPNNYLAPSGLSDFERSHLRDAFVVVKTMQSALTQGLPT